MLDVNLFWTSSLLLAAVFYFDMPTWALLLILGFAFLMLVIVWIRCGEPKEDDDDSGNT